MTSAATWEDGLETGRKDMLARAEAAEKECARLNECIRIADKGQSEAEYREALFETALRQIRKRCFDDSQWARYIDLIFKAAGDKL
jgi:hypothetical protein